MSISELLLASSKILENNNCWSGAGPLQKSSVGQSLPELYMLSNPNRKPSGQIQTRNQLACVGHGAASNIENSYSHHLLPLMCLRRVLLCHLELEIELRLVVEANCVTFLGAKNNTGAQEEVGCGVVARDL